MRRFVAVLLVSMLAVSLSAVAENGVNRSLPLDGTGIASLQYADVVHGNGQFEISLALDEGTNITSIQWITQICTNNLVCRAPVTTDMDTEDGLTYNATLHSQMLDDMQFENHTTYLNWIFHLYSEDESSHYLPADGFFHDNWKVWSDCWHISDYVAEERKKIWGGTSTDCQFRTNEYGPVWETGIADVQFEEMVYGGRDYAMSISLEEDSDVTSVQWITQICINTGVCFAPETNEMSSDDGVTYSSQVDVNETAAYINWKFVLHHEDGSQTGVPETGFGWKVWSDCWWDNGVWGGPSTECQEEEEEEGLPGFAAPAAAAAIAMAALMARRD
ncbi:uncharacterized protein METZ01_LOCUS223540 [marine metagenome]|uniref:PGF-CTERM sorting domain-containing protein n=1 Tax=marine metagenome TaxID=408172 RepID=A0A382G5Y2_9ZZZZ